MKKELSIRSVFIDSLGFIGNNKLLLCFLTILSYAGAAMALLYNNSQNMLYLLAYALYLYFFYFFFVSLYFNQRPLITKEKFVDSLIKLAAILAMSLFVIICGSLGLKFLHYLSKSLIGFSDLYNILRTVYIFMAQNEFAKIMIYLGVIMLLTFTFFIPGFAWISIINGQDRSIVSAFAKIRGNYLPTIAVFVSLYGILPLITGFIVLNSSYWTMAIVYALQTIFQIIVYLHLYDKFYHNT